MRALLIDCHKNTAVCLEEIMKELAQIRFQVNILAESRTSLRCNSITECAVSSNLNGIYPRCGNETLAAIHWGKLDSTSAKRSSPKSTEMKIRPVEFTNFTQSSSGANPYLIPHLRHSHTIEHLYFIFNSAELYKSGRRVRGVYLIDPDDLGAFNASSRFRSKNWQNCYLEYGWFETGTTAANYRLYLSNIITKNCAELYKSGQRISVVYTIDPDGSGAFNVYCDQTTTGGGWTVIQKRMDGSVDFNRTWDDYKHGFGNLVGEFWLGLDKINRLTRNKTKNKLRVDLGVKTGKTVHSEYGWFGIGTETAKYSLNLGKIIGFGFGTWDKVHAGCTQKIGGGWWYDSSITECEVSSNLNGIYRRCGKGTLAAIHWGYLDGSAENSAPASTEMKIRPVEFMRVA
ncbi:hypothetical protein pdam_00021166, partial [Pocillopora damicornis]